MQSVERAAAGASVAALRSAPGDLHRQYLTFALKGESYAVPIESVKEIIEFGALTGDFFSDEAGRIIADAEAAELLEL